jgi:DNA/RNA-binding domain of Phe-tRNA-synthetase-like protein
LFEIHASPRWRASFPGGQIGLLLLGEANNTPRETALEAYKRELEIRLRKQYGGLSRADLLELPVLQAYKAYYRSFNKTYHVQLQLESVVFKGRQLPSVSPLVDAVFAAELETLILTAGHDGDRLVPPVTIDASQGDESYTGLNGEHRRPKRGDMLMRDEQGVVCTILYGQDGRTPITERTKRALYVAYVPAGIEAEQVEAHLDRIEANVRLFAPWVDVEFREILLANRE